MEYSVKSATYAMRGKQLLIENGIRAGVGKHLKETGCEYFLKVPERNAEAAKEILIKNNIMA